MDIENHNNLMAAYLSYLQEVHLKNTSRGSAGNKTYRM